MAVLPWASMVVGNECDDVRCFCGEARNDSNRTLHGWQIVAPAAAPAAGEDSEFSPVVFATGLLTAGTWQHRDA